MRKRLYFNRFRPFHFRFRFRPSNFRFQLFLRFYVTIKGIISFDKDLRSFRIVINYFRGFMIYKTILIEIKILHLI